MTETQEEKEKLQDSYDNVTEEVFQDVEEYVTNPRSGIILLILAI